MGRKVRGVLWGLEGRGSRMTKEQENQGNIPETSIVCSPTNLVCRQFCPPILVPFQVSGVATATRRKPSIWLCPSGHFYNVGWVALENPILFPTAL